jgi:hypothetical protein
MKHLSLLLLLSVFLASCGQEIAPPTSSPVSPVKTEVVAPISETSETLKSENKTNERELLNIENSKDSISKCGEDFNHDDANEFVPFEIKGLSISIPFNHAWGTSKCRVSPYEEFNNEVYFGGTFGGIEGYDFGRNYSISIVPSRKSEDIIHDIKKEKDTYLKDNNQVPVTFLTPEIITLNEFTAVSWEGVPGLTDSSNIEIVWKNANYIFRALDSKENLIKLVRSMNLASTKTNSSTSNTISPLSDTQIQDILAKIDANTKAQQEIAKHATGVLVQGDFRAEFVWSKDNTDDVLKIDIWGKKLKYFFPYNSINKEYCTEWEKECTQRSKFSGFDWFSPNRKFLAYHMTWYGGSVLRIIDLQNNETFNLFEERVLSWLWSGKVLIFAPSRGPVWELRIYDISNSFKEPLFSTPWEIDELSGFYLDEKYFYGMLNIFDGQRDLPYLKIYSLSNLKEVFSKEIPN